MRAMIVARRLGQRDRDEVLLPLSIQPIEVA